MVAVLEKQKKVDEKRRKQQAFFDKYQNDPIAFMVDCLDVEKDFVWSKMREICASVVNNQKTCVFAGHSVSKTYLFARLVLWFLYTHKPSTVITTASSFDLVEKALWKEIHTAHTNAKIPLGGHITKVQLDVDPDRKWFAYGMATKPDTVTQEATAMHGKHNKYVLLLYDEAAAVMPQIWKAGDSLLVDENCKAIAGGNPTSATGTFAEMENDPTWNFIRISVLETPNYIHGKEIIPGVAGRSFEKMMRLKYGEESNEYAIRVLGRKPEFTQGTYLGRGLAKALKQGRVGLVGLYDATAPVYTFSDIGDMYSAFIFVQFIKEQLRIIDFYYDCEGKGLPFYSVMLQEKGYRYGGHYSLPDIFQKGSNQKSSHTGLYTVDVAHSLGIDFEKVELPSRDDCIRAGQDLCDKCWFDVKAQECFDGLQDWKRRKNEALSTPEKPEYFEDAVKTWGRHVGDAFCGMAVAYRTMEIGGKVIGSIIPVIKNYYENEEFEIYDNSPSLGGF